MRIPIQPYQRQVLQDARGPIPRVDAVRPTGIAALAGVTDDILERDRREQERRANELKRVEFEQKKARVLDRVRNDRLTWTQTIQERQSAAEPGAEGFTPALLKDFDAYRKKATESIQDEEERRIYDAQLSHLNDTVAESAMVFESNARRAYRKQVLGDGLDKGARTLTIDPTQHAQVLAGELASIDISTDLTAAEKARMAEQAREGLSWAAAHTLTLREPAAVLARMERGDINADPIFGQLKPERLQQIRAIAQTELQRGVSNERTRLAAQERDLQAMVMSGVEPPTAPSVDEYVKAFGPDGARRYEAEVGTYLRVGNGIKAMRTGSPAERAAVIMAATPQAGEGFAEQAKVQAALVQANQAIEKRLKDDPALYAAENSPQVAQAQRVMSAVLENPGLSNPRPGVDSDRGSRAGVIDFYARTMAAEQKRMGVDQVQLLTDQQASATAQQFYDQKTGGKNAADLVAGLEETWGNWWPTVYAQLAKDGKMPPAALVIPNMKDKGARTRLAEWSVMKPADRKALLAGTDERDIRDKVLSQFEAAAPSFLAQGGGGQRTVAVVIDQAEILAAGYRSQGKSISDAAAQAYDEVMGWKYEFGPTYRVPKEQQPAQVQEGTRAYLAALQDVRVPSIPGVDSEAVRAQMLDAVRANPMWITNRDETGLRLMVKGQDGGVYQVNGATGKPIELSWGELRSSALAARTADALKLPKLPELMTRNELPPPGMIAAGNIDLATRPTVKNADGSISTIRSIGVNVDGVEVLLPTIADDGTELTEKQAIDLYKATGRHLGKFDTAAASTAYAKRLSEQQGQAAAKKKPGR
jgi:hypothetical protein